jgi:hypothetical protein
MDMEVLRHRELENLIAKWWNEAQDDVTYQKVYDWLSAITLERKPEVPDPIIDRVVRNQQRMDDQTTLHNQISGEDVLRRILYKNMTSYQCHIYGDENTTISFYALQQLMHRRGRLITVDQRQFILTFTPGEPGTISSAMDVPDEIGVLVVPLKV